MFVLAARLKRHQLLQRTAAEGTLKGSNSTSQGRRLLENSSCILNMICSLGAIARGGCDGRASNGRLSNCLRCRRVEPVNAEDGQARECDKLAVQGYDWLSSESSELAKRPYRPVQEQLSKAWLCRLHVQ